MAAYKRKIYLINPKFQIKFSLLVCLLVFISSIVYPMVIYDVYDNFITYISKQVPEFSGPLLASFNQKKVHLMIFLGLWQVGFTAIVFIACIFMSHKIAGPLYKLQTYFKRISDGDPPEKLFFRRGDYFQNIADDFNETFQALHDKYQKDFAYISEVNAYLSNLVAIVPEDKKVILLEIHKKLHEIQRRFDAY